MATTVISSTHVMSLLFQMRTRLYHHIIRPDHTLFFMKRRVDDDYDDYDDQGKRHQDHMIHTEAHHRTVALMMASARYLPQTTPREDTIVQEEIPPQTSFHQRPFWPQITRVVK